MSKQIAMAELRAGGKELQRVGEQIGEATRTLSQETTSQNSPWGGDEIGSVFGSLYTPLAQKAFEFYQELGEGVGELGDWLYQRAEAQEKVEEENASRLKKIQDRLQVGD